MANYTALYTDRQVEQTGIVIMNCFKVILNTLFEFMLVND